MSQPIPVGLNETDWHIIRAFIKTGILGLLDDMDEAPPGEYWFTLRQIRELIPKLNFSPKREAWLLKDIDIYIESEELNKKFNKEFKKLNKQFNKEFKEYFDPELGGEG